MKNSEHVVHPAGPTTPPQDALRASAGYHHNSNTVQLPLLLEVANFSHLIHISGAAQTSDMLTTSIKRKMANLGQDGGATKVIVILTRSSSSI